MRELTRSNDPVFLSYLTSELAAEGIETVMLDTFGASVLAPMNVTALRRVMIDDDDDVGLAEAVLAEAEGRVSEDTILDGRVTLLQPVRGFRAAIDPVLLAACVPAMNGDRVLDVGTGSGAAAFALLARMPWTWVTGIDMQADLIHLARLSARRNDAVERARFAVVDIADAAAFQPAPFDHVMSNPPFLGKHNGQRPKDPARARATLESTADLGMWLRFMVANVSVGGTVSVVHRHDRIDEILRHLEALGCGEVKVLDLLSVDDGRPVKRAVVQASKDRQHAQVQRSRMVLHTPDGQFTPDALAILRDLAAIPMSERSTDE